MLNLFLLYILNYVIQFLTLETITELQIKNTAQVNERKKKKKKNYR